MLKKKKWINWIDPFNTHPDVTGTKRIALISVEARDGTTINRFHISIFYEKNISHRKRDDDFFVKKTLTSERGFLGIFIDDGKLFIGEAEKVFGKLAFLPYVCIGYGHVVGIDVDADAVVEECSDRMLAEVWHFLGLHVACQAAFDEDTLFLDDVHGFLVMDDAASVTKPSCSIFDGIHDIGDGLALTGMDGEWDM